MLLDRMEVIPREPCQMRSLVGEDFVPFTIGHFHCGWMRGFLENYSCDCHIAYKVPASHFDLSEQVGRDWTSVRSHEDQF